MRFEHHEESRYSRYSRISKAQRGRIVIYAVLLIVVLAVMYILAQRAKPGPIAWLPSFEEALAQAKAANKPIMAFFFAEGNAECRRMDDETFTDKAVRAEARTFVCVRLDGKAHPELVKRYLMVAVYPSVAFISSDGKPVLAVLNHRAPEDFLGEMQAALQPREPSPSPSEPSGTETEREALTESPSLLPRNAEPSRGDAE